mgnify:CR=1 FL=1
MFSAARGSVGESMSNRVSHGLAPSTSNPMDVIACDAISQFFSTNTRGKTPLGMISYFLDACILPPERRLPRLWLLGEVMLVFGGLTLFFASTLGDFEATDTLGIAATSVASLSVLCLVTACIMSAAAVFSVALPDLTSVYVGFKMLGWAASFGVNGTILSFVAFVLTGLARANGALVGWIVCGMGIVIFLALNVFFALTTMALLPLLHFHQEAWYHQAFAPNIALSNYVMGRKSLREGVEIQLAKILAGPIPEDLRLVLDGGAKEV